MAFEALVAHLAGRLGWTPGDEAGLRLLAMTAVAWADGEVQAWEREAIVAEIRRARSDPKERAAAVERAVSLLSAPPGPYFEPALLMLLRILQGRQAPDAARAFGSGLVTACKALERPGSRIMRMFRRLVNPEDETRAGIRRFRDSLLDPLPDEALAIVESVLVSREEARAGGHTVPEPGRVRWISCLHAGPEASLQVRGLVFGQSGPAVTLACLEASTPGAELAMPRVERSLTGLAHRPHIERWTALQLEIAGLTRPPVPEVVDGLAAEVEQKAGGPVHRIPLVLMCLLEDELASRHGQAGWVAGQLTELLVDHEVVVRPVAPGTFHCPRPELTWSAVHRRLLPSVPGLGFCTLELRARGGTALNLAMPEQVGPLSPDAARWLGDFLPRIHDPLSAPQVGYLEEGEPTWLMELRSGVPAQIDALCPEALPEGRALVIAPWLWLRAAWALGVVDAGR